MSRLHPYRRACLNIHFRHLHAPLCSIIAPNSGYIARYAPFIRDKSPTNCDVHLTESNFQTHSRAAPAGTMSRNREPCPGQPHPRSQLRSLPSLERHLERPSLCRPSRLPKIPGCVLDVLYKKKDFCFFISLVQNY